MSDPRYPRRPQHPDFWIMSEVLIDTDTQMDNYPQFFADVTGRLIDPEVLAYVALQRAQRALQGTPASAAVHAKLAAAWMDGFVMALQYQHRKTTRSQDVPDEPPDDPGGLW